MSLKVDDLFNIWEERYEKVMKLIPSNPKVFYKMLWGEIFPYDRCCQGMDASGRYGKVCGDCSSVCSIKRGNMKNFIIEYGSMIGEEMEIVDEKPSTQLTVLIDDHTKLKTDFYIRAQKDILLCGTIRTDGMTFLSCEKITNKILVSWIVDSIIGYRRRIKSVHACKDNIVELTFKTFKEEPGNERNTLKQLAIYMKKLQHFQFCLGNPSIESLRWYRRPASYISDGIKISSPTTLVIVPDEESSISTGETRICCQTRNSFKSYTDSVIRIERVVSGDLTYQVSDSVLEDRKSGVPIYPTSYDLCMILKDLYKMPAYRDLLDTMGWNILFSNSTKEWFKCEAVNIFHRLCQNI